jgi:hypothetical protein
MKTAHDLFDAVIEQIKVDLGNGDCSAIDALLATVPRENLISYLPEEQWAEHLNEEVA